MSQKQIALIDYGMANLLNVVRAFEYCGATVRVIDEPRDVRGVERLVLPGVGAFRNCMNELVSRGFDDALRHYVDTGRPMLGICVGMQALFEASEEFGEYQGLGLLPGRVRAVPRYAIDGTPQRVPHIGWNHLVEPATGRHWSGTLLEPFIGQSPGVYFVHSFAAQPTVSDDCLADCVYGGHKICAAIQRGNLMATQFHPERSGELGLKILRQFLSA